MDQPSGNLIILIIAYIILFLHGLKGFSKELQDVGSDYLKKALQKVSSSKIGGLLFGATLTGIIQSSSAVTSITVAMVDAGVFSFQGSLAIMLGANVGTTATSWLVSYKLTGLGPILIILGTFVGLLPYRIKLIGNSLFYFGFILFSLDLINSTLKPLQNEPFVKDILSQWNNPYLGILGGMLATAIVQSSSVVSGMAILLHTYNFISLEEGIGVVIGSIIGTTSTALIASTQLSRMAKLSAIANFLFNFCGALVMIPFLYPIKNLVLGLSDSPAIQIALAHSLITATIAFSFIWFTSQTGRWLLTWRLAKDTPVHSDTIHSEDLG